MPLQIIVPSTKRLHSTLGALGCPPLLGAGPALGTGFALTSFSPQNLPKMMSLRGLSWFWYLGHLWVQRQGKVGICGGGGFRNGKVESEEGKAWQIEQSGIAKWDVLGSTCMVWVHPLALMVLLPQYPRSRCGVPRDRLCKLCRNPGLAGEVAWGGFPGLAWILTGLRYLL